MKMVDYYKILGVDRQASPEEIKKAYRKLAKQFHPDVVKEDKVKQDYMYQIQEAYACLENEERRKKYDVEYLKSMQGAANAQRKRESSKRTFEKRDTDKSPFEQFFGFQPGKGMETYQDKRTNKSQGPIKPEEMFASFFGKGSMRGTEKGNTFAKKSKTDF